MWEGEAPAIPRGLRPGFISVVAGHNPFRVVFDSGTRSQRSWVARSSQPWALLRNPFGIQFQVFLNPPQFRKTGTRIFPRSQLRHPLFSPYEPMATLASHCHAWSGSNLLLECP